MRARLGYVLATSTQEASTLDEQLLTEAILWSWVVYVLWATQRSWG
jgi:hypothetical protein